MGSVPDPLNKVCLAIMQFVIFLLVEGLAFNSLKNAISMQCNKAKCSKMRYAYIRN